MRVMCFGRRSWRPPRATLHWAAWPAVDASVSPVGLCSRNPDTTHGTAMPTLTPPLAPPQLIGGSMAVPCVVSGREEQHPDAPGPSCAGVGPSNPYGFEGPRPVNGASGQRKSRGCDRKGERTRKDAETKRSFALRHAAAGGSAPWTGRYVQVYLFFCGGHVPFSKVLWRLQVAPSPNSVAPPNSKDLQHFSLVVGIV